MSKQAAGSRPRLVAEALVRICGALMTKALPGGWLAFRAQTVTLLDPAGRRSLTNANRSDRELPDVGGCGSRPRRNFYGRASRELAVTRPRDDSRRYP